MGFNSAFKGLISAKRDLMTFIFCSIILFLILSFLEIRAERRQKSIFVEFSFVTGFSFKHHVSAPYVIVLLTVALYIIYTNRRQRLLIDTCEA